MHSSAPFLPISRTICHDARLRSWPYSELQLTTLMSFLLAATVMSETALKHTFGLDQ